MVKLKNNGHTSSDKVTMNLLDSSESDVEWLNLPPIKGKKPKRRKSVKQKDAGCGLWNIVKPFMFLAVLGAVVLLTVTTVWLTTKVSDLQNRLERIEGKSVVSIEDIQKLFSQMSALNKSQTLESKQLTQFQANISSLNVKLLKLSGDVEKLGQGLKAAPELKQLPEKLQTVSKSLATLGSDVTGMKDTVSSIQTSMKDTGTKLQDINAKIEALKEDTDSGETTTNEVPPEISNMIQTFSRRLEDMNSTTSAQLSVMMKSLSQHEERFVSLENVTDTLRKNFSTMSSDHSSISNEHAAMTDVLSSEQFKTTVTDVVHSMLNQMNHTASSTNETHSAEPAAPIAILSSVKDSLDKIQGKYDHLNNTVQKNAEDIQNIRKTFVPVQMFTQFGEEFQAYTVYQNATIAKLTAKVEGKTASPQPVSQAPVTEGSKDNSSTSANSNSVTTKPESSTEKPVSTETETKTTKAPVIPSVIIPGIQTAEALENAFRSWDRLGSGQVQYTVLPDYLGPNTPKESELKPFDEDHNDLYTIQEFAKALGITLDEEPHNTEPSEGREQ